MTQRLLQLAESNQATLRIIKKGQVGGSNESAFGGMGFDLLYEGFLVESPDRNIVIKIFADSAWSDTRIVTYENEASALLKLHHVRGVPNLLGIRAALGEQHSLYMEGLAGEKVDSLCRIDYPLFSIISKVKDVRIELFATKPALITLGMETPCRDP